MAATDQPEAGAEPSRWRVAGRVLGDLLFPPVCLHCGDLCEDSRLRHLCGRCTALLTLVEPPHCTTCGHPFYGEVVGERMCPHCEGLRPEFGEGRTLTLYQGGAKALVQELKYHRGLFVLEDMAALLRGHTGLLAYVRDAVLVPVPLHPRKERERGYNQSMGWAEILAREAGGRTRVEPLLRRVVDTASQTTFDRETRRKRIKNAFAPVPEAALNTQSRFLLVDDVFTTGSTLNACAHALRSAGALKVDVVTFGHG
jgi:ComF family protein